jgi:hypothetical protein
MVRPHREPLAGEVEIDESYVGALDVGLLDHGSERLLGHPARLEEARE